MNFFIKKRETVIKETKFDRFMQEKLSNLHNVRGGENPPFDPDGTEKKKEDNEK